jgi:pilus assembly protein Flp/PilA
MLRCNIIGLLHDEDGASMVEYALMVAMIAVVCIAVISTLGKKVNNSFQVISNNMGP